MASLGLLPIPLDDEGSSVCTDINTLIVSLCPKNHLLMTHLHGLWTARVEGTFTEDAKIWNGMSERMDVCSISTASFNVPQLSIFFAVCIEVHRAPDNGTRSSHNEYQ